MERVADPSRAEIILLQVVAPVGVGEVTREGESSACPALPSDTSARTDTRKGSGGGSKAKG